ncbi:hypothetical protein CsSME_00024639 [Camellia sinensis var. sinensis]
MASFRSLKSAIFDREERKQCFSVCRQYQAHIRGLNAYDRHKKFLNDYVCNSIFIIILHRFIRSEEDDLNPSWEQKLVKRYYDKLFKEYPLQTCFIGLRWRTEKEVVSGKGQFVCGNKHCNEKDGLASYEESVNFSYFEAGENKQALVKLVTCERCAEKLLYKKMKEKEQLRKREKEELLKKRERSESGDGTDTGYGRSKKRKKERVASTSASDHKSKSDDDENFDEFLEGMFP